MTWILRLALALAAAPMLSRRRWRAPPPTRRRRRSTRSRRPRRASSRTRASRAPASRSCGPTASSGRAGSALPIATPAVRSMPTRSSASGSVSKTFVAMALVQLYEEGQLDLDAPVASLVPEVRIDNPWEASDPVRVRHLLEHTAGFDDMHFNEIYVLDDAPDRPLDEVLLRSPASRRVRWRPGTRMAYSNPGYAVAGRVVEAVSGMRFDQFILERIFAPLEMKTLDLLRRCRGPRPWRRATTRATGPPVMRRRIHLRPAGALHSSPRELGHFVEMLLNWGERQRRLRRRSRVPVEHGVAAHDRSVDRRRAGRLRPRHLQHPRPAVSRARTSGRHRRFPAPSTATRRRAMSASWCC